MSTFLENEQVELGNSSLDVTTLKSVRPLRPDF